MNQSTLELTLPHGYKTFPTSWICNNLHKTYNVTKHDLPNPEDAIPHPILGWICGCGQWTMGTDTSHKSLTYADYYIDPTAFPYSIFKLSLEERASCLQYDPINPYEHPNVKCDQCQLTTHESHIINGVWICINCYPDALQYCDCHG